MHLERLPIDARCFVSLRLSLLAGVVAGEVSIGSWTMRVRIAYLATPPKLGMALILQ